MKFTVNWLKDFLDFDCDLDTLSQTLTAIGLEVEEIVDASAELSAFEVAHILETDKHPDADKLQVCKVETSGGVQQIVCGAPNARPGIKVALAKVGSIIPTNGMKIKASKIRGVESNGMLCSTRELGLGDDHDGIMELPADAEVGYSIVHVLGLNDPMIEIAITPNRGDCLGVYGIARDLAAAGLGTLKPLAMPSIKTAGDPLVRIDIQDKAACSMFVGRAIKGVKNTPSPDWLQRRLQAIGLRPISTLVDITNYITFTYGRPLHVYDMAKLQGDITVRQAEPGESFDALNDKSYTLKGGECVIADESGMLGLGGIVGGEPSGVTEDTTDVLLECAWFDPINIATTGRALGVESDARYRFERTVDPQFVEAGAELATQMILELCGGEAYGSYVAGDVPDGKTPVSTSMRFINNLGGVALDEQMVQSILTSLGFITEIKDGQIETTAPSWRPDISQAADIAEEVLRIYRYDNIERVSLPKLPQARTHVMQPAQQRSGLSRRSLAQRGLLETHTWAFLSQATAERFGGGDEALRLMNPISSDLSTMRPSLLPNLIEAVGRNIARGFGDVGLFEVGPQFNGTSAKEQLTVACALRTGRATPKQWMADARVSDTYDAKADALAIIEACGMQADKVQIVREAPDWYHPGRSGAIKLGPKNTLAYFGELHPTTLKAMDVEQPVVACEVFLDAIPYPKQKGAARQALSRSDYQSVARDFAFIVDADQPSGDILRAINGADKKLIRSVELFDVYQGKGIEDGKKSLALRVSLQADDRTLQDEEIENVVKAVVEAAGKFGATLRG